MTRRRGSWAIAATSLVMLFVSASPALAEMSCRRWDFQNQTFYMNQSNGYVLRITFGQSSNQRGAIHFDKNGTINIERQGGAGDFASPPRFVPNTGALVFSVYWRPPADRPNDVNRGTYIGEPRNIRQAGDGGLIADLSGYTTGEEIAEPTLLEWLYDPTTGALSNESQRRYAVAKWNAPARLLCRPENVLLDGQTAKEQDQARKAAAAAAAAPPPKPLSRTGRARPSGPPVAHRLAFTGAWDTPVAGGIGYKLILQPQGSGMSPIGGEMPLEVVGAFTYNRFGDIAVKPGEHDNNGSLRGVVAPYARTLVFSYAQRNGSAGSGAFTLSDDGQSITGSIENSDGKSAWTGTRAN
jgi:hypothetical protein